MNNHLKDKNKLIYHAQNLNGWKGQLNRLNRPLDLPQGVALFRYVYIYEPRHDKTCLMSYVNNKGADQTAPSVPLLFAT